MVPCKARACCVAPSAKLRSQCHLLRGDKHRWGVHHPAEAAPAGPTANPPVDKAFPVGAGAVAWQSPTALGGGTVCCAVPQKLSWFYTAPQVTEGVRGVMGWPGTDSPKEQGSAAAEHWPNHPAAKIEIKKPRRSCSRASPASPARCRPVEKPRLGSSSWRRSAGGLTHKPHAKKATQAGFAEPTL